MRAGLGMVFRETLVRRAIGVLSTESLTTECSRLQDPRTFVLGCVGPSSGALPQLHVLE